MNTPSFRSLSGTIPKSNKSNEKSSTFVVGSDGLAIVLNKEGHLIYSFTKASSLNSSAINQDNSSSHVLPLSADSKEVFQKAQFTDIVLNREGSTLLLWSRETNLVAIVELSIVIQQNEKKLRESKLVSVTLKSSQPTSPIVKVAYHPFSSYHIVTLHQRGSIILTDLRTMSSQVVSLRRELSFVSFTFGPFIDWMTATLFLLEKSGDIYALCPILPYKCTLPEQTIEEMYVWLEEQREVFDGSYIDSDGRESVYRGGNSSHLVSQYISTAKSYLLSTLAQSDPDGDDDKGTENEEEDNILGVNTTSTGYASDSVLSTLGSIGTAAVQTQSIDYRIPTLQGPIKPRRSEVSRMATDICVPASSQGQSVPALLISYSNGDIDAYLVGCPAGSNPNSDSYGGSDVYANAYGGEEASGVGPSWIPDEEDAGTLFSYPLPSLQLVERVAVGVALPATQILPSSTATPTAQPASLSWQLIPDPVHSSYVHVVSKDGCAAFLVSLRWLRALIDRQCQLEKSLSLSHGQENSGGTAVSERSLAPVSRTTTTLSMHLRTQSTQSPLMKNYSLNFHDEAQQRSEGEVEEDVGLDIVSEQRRLETNNYREEAEDPIEPFEFEESRIISMFCPAQESTPAGGVAEKVRLSGVQVLYDTMAGHLAVFQTSTGLIASVNLTSHVQFCESQISFQEKLGLVDQSRASSLHTSSVDVSSTSSLELKIAQKQQFAHEESLTKLFQQAIQGLSRVPVSVSAVQLKVEKNSQNSASNGAEEALLTAKIHLEKEVSLPLQEIAQRLKYRVESLHDLYHIQTKLLSGDGASVSGVGAALRSNTEDDDRKKAHQLGLTRQVERLKREHEQTLLRVEKIQETYTQQYKRAESLLQTVSFLRGKVTPGEREYYERLRRWSESATVLENKLESLTQLQARVLAQTAPQITTAVEPVVNSTSSTTGTAAVESSATVEPADKSVSALTTQLTDQLALNTPLRPGASSASTAQSASAPPLSARAVSGSKPYIFTSPIVAKSGFKQTLYTTPLTQKHGGGATPLSTHANKPTYVSAYGTPTTFLNQRRSAQSETKGVLSPSPNSTGGLSDRDLEQCFKIQAAQTEMLHASVAELKQLETKLQTYLH